MTNTVEFPGLGLSFDINNVAFSVFGIDIYWYGVLIGLGMALAVLFAFKNANSFGIDVDRMIDVIFVGFVCAIVGGRLYYVLFVDARYYSFLDLINLRLGGIAIYGGIIGAFIGAAAACKWRKVPMLPMFDLTAMGFLIGQCLGRWGNFFNQEAFGDNTQSIFGMISPTTTQYLLNREEWLTGKGIFVDPYMPVHPTFLYESVWCALGFFLLWRYMKHRKFNGELFLMYVMWYGAGRFVIEGLRTDSLMIGGVRVSQALALASAVAAAALWLWARKKTAGKPLVVPEIPPHTAKVKLETEDGPQTVVISWPANERAPTAEQRRELAHKVLHAQKKAAETDDDAAGAEEEAEEKPKENVKTGKGTQEEKAPVKDGAGSADKKPAAGGARDAEDEKDADD